MSDQSKIKGDPVKLKWVLCADHKRKVLTAVKIKVFCELQAAGKTFLIHRHPDAQRQFAVTEFSTGCIFFNQYFSSVAEAKSYAVGYFQKADPQTVLNWHKKKQSEVNYYFGGCFNS